MNARGERILIFGDSLSHPGPDNGPEAFEITQDSNRVSSAPGDLLGSLLLEQGAEAVRLDARVGRSAWNFWGRESANDLIAADAAWGPTKVVVMLGTNDIGLQGDGERQAMQAIKDAYEAMGAEVWAIGPFTYTGQGGHLNPGAEDVASMMSDVFGSRFIDGRPLSVNVDRARDGIHFQPTSAMQTAYNLADALISSSSRPLWQTVLIGGALIGLLIAGGTWWKKHRALRA